jgi:serine/threonine-protein phosphatase 6 regulatory ankyrin repeat subunit B
MKRFLVAIILPTILLLSRLAAGQAAPGSVDEQLITAAAIGDTAAVQQLLDKSANIEAKDKYGMTPLHRAAYYGKTDVVKLLLDKGANIEAKDNDGETALNRAAMYNFADIVKLLLDHGANVDIRDKNGYTALIFAAANGSVDLVKLLLDKGANIGAKDNDGRTALGSAAERGNVDIVKLLLDKGVNIGAKDNDVNTALLKAAREGHTDVVTLLLNKGANIESKDKGGETALLRAAYGGKTDVLNLLLDNGANIEAKDNDGNTALLVATYNGKTDVVKLLLNKGANIEAKGAAGSPYFGNTALIVAARDGFADVVKLLLEKGANIESKDNVGNTVLLVATHYGYGKTDVVKLLLDRGANIEAKDEYGNTALIVAALDGHADVVSLLLEKGANIEARDKSGKTTLMEAAEEGHANVVKLLLDKGANIEAKGTQSPYKSYTPLSFAISRGNTEVVKLLVEKGADIEDKNDALRFAAAKGDTVVLKLLLEEGANIEAKDGVGRTPLMNAAVHGHADAVKLLLDKGANIEVKDNNGYTALVMATRERSMWENVVKTEHQTEAFAGADIVWKNNAKELANITEVVHLLEQTLSQDPQAKLAEYLSELQLNPSDDVRRDKVIKAAVSLPSLPAIPEEARQLFLQASALIKQTSNPDDLGQPIGLLRKALIIAPWWGNAYYNLSRALELSGQYDDAVKQLNYYLELKPSEADANDARAKIAVLQAEKVTAAQKKQENESLLAVKYVSGGATRLRWTDAPASWTINGAHGINDLYTYWVPEEDPFYINVFRMPNGQMLAITLQAQANNGAYKGDKIGIFSLPATSGACLEGGNPSFAFGVQDHTSACGAQYDVGVTNQPNATVTVTNSATGASVTLPVALLYRGRALQARGPWGAIGGCSGMAFQGGTSAMVLKFDCSVVNAAKDPNVNAMGLTPISVTPYQNNQ